MMFSANPARIRNSQDEALLLLSQYGVVGGVEFDLRGANLPNQLWHWPRFITTPAPGHPGLFIVADLDSTTETLIGVTVGSLERSALEQAREKGMDLLYPGDRVSAKSTITTISDDPFALEPDQRVAVVSLTVTRPGGETAKLKPLLVLLRGNLLAAHEGDTLARLRERLQSLDAPDLAALSDRLEIEAMTFQRTLMGMRPETEGRGLLAGLEIPFAAAEFDRVLNLAALYAFEQGRREAERKMKAPAVERLKRLAADRDGATKSAAARTKWQEAVFEYALEECARDPAISGSALARLIIRAKASKQFEYVPEVVRLTDIIRDWRTKGRLPPKAKAPAR